MIENAISYNLKRLRIARHLSKKKISEDAGLSRVAYSNIENGKAEPRVSNLQRIGNVLGVGIQELVTPAPNISSLRFRSLKTLSSVEVSKRKQIVGDVANWLKDFNEIEGMLDNKIAYSFKTPYHKESEPRKVAKEIRGRLDLAPAEVINDICGLLESAGIKIYPVGSDLSKFFGLSVAEPDGGPAIGINTSDNISIERQIFTVAHELGHLLLHKDSYNASGLKEDKRQENEADEFASYFLMPQEAFDKKWKENRGKHWLDGVLHIKRIFKVSFGTVLNRLIEVGVTDNSIWRKFYWTYEQKFGKKLTDHKEPEGLDGSGKEPIGLVEADFTEDRLSCLVREALEKELISFSRAAEILKISIEKMRERTNSWKLLK
ncbi:MAG: ImmA/IrrE family metallo-endopeptidase [Candidatus Omnitrophica bacterium]|nr:ImmA/IrrE family metallo-endopeptidase [Candidatus Omnitrophota bacterium]